ncbi:MAG: hypothetical protein ACE5IK_14310, partial [Acidobacteriota bacterium]
MRRQRLAAGQRRQGGAHTRPAAMALLALSGLWLPGLALPAGPQGTLEEVSPRAAEAGEMTGTAAAGGRQAASRLLVHLGEIPAPTGAEKPLRDTMRAELRAGGAVSVDRHGNLLVDVAPPRT